MVDEDSAPVISPIFKDFRGSSWAIKFPDGREGVMIFTRKGMFRGGHSHNKPETSMCLSGGWHYWKRLSSGQEIEFDKGPGEPLHNDAGEVHLGQATSDGWLFDWKPDIKAGEFTTTNDPQYRKKVDEQMAQYKALNTK